MVVSIFRLAQIILLALPVKLINSIHQHFHDVRRNKKKVKERITWYEI